MKILVINAGSSSLKYQLIDMNGEKVLAQGNCERIGIGGFITHKVGDYKDQHNAEFPTHVEALEEVIRLLSTGDMAVIKSMDEISAVGHRVVQGAELYTKSTLVTESGLKELEKFNDLAPLHNPPGIMAIKACQEIMGNIPHVMVFDTSFHQTMPEKAYFYPLPYELCKKYSIRRYGFHGTSHRYVTQRLGEITGKDVKNLKIVTCHLGNGSSITAVDGGESVDTTMGFTPLEGLEMGTRCGSIDPSIVTFLMDKENLSTEEISNMMNKQSGYLGVSGVTSDQRDLSLAADEGNERAKLALEIQRYQITKYIGSFAAAMGGLDYIVFTGGIGEHDETVRELSCSSLEFMGVKVDHQKNIDAFGVEADIATDDSKVRVFVIPTNEELMIARDTKAIVEA